MSSELVFSVATREKVGKGNARALRRLGYIPALVYGDNQPSAHVYLEKKQFNRHLDDDALFNEVYNLDIEGKQESVLVREIQFNPLRSHEPTHVNFLRVGKNSVVSIEVPIVLTNQAICNGLKLGGVLNVITHSLEVRCNPKNAPKSIEIDLKDARIGSVIKIEDVVLPKGVKVFYPEGFALVSITAADQDSSQSADVEQAEA